MFTLILTSSTRAYRPTNVCSQDDLYAFPPLEICFWTGLGCDKGFSLGECVASVKTTIHPSSNKSAEEFEFPSQVSAHKHYGFKIMCSKQSMHCQTRGYLWFRPSNVWFPCHISAHNPSNVVFGTLSGQCQQKAELSGSGSPTVSMLPMKMSDHVRSSLQGNMLVVTTEMTCYENKINYHAFFSAQTAKWKPILASRLQVTTDHITTASRPFCPTRGKIV